MITDSIAVDDLHINWNKPKGTGTLTGLAVALIWIDYAQSALQRSKIIGTARPALPLHIVARKSNDNFGEQYTHLVRSKKFLTRLTKLEEKCVKET